MPSQEFKEAVENQDVRRVRIMLGDRIIIDPTFQTFYNDLNYAKELVKISLNHTIINLQMKILKTGQRKVSREKS